MNQSCVGFFAAWQNRIENESGHWNARNVQTGELFLNATTRRRFNIDHQIIRWDDAIYRVCVNDVDRFERAQSLVLKTGGVKEIIIGVKETPAKTILLPHIITSVHCLCRAQSLILILTYPE